MKKLIKKRLKKLNERFDHIVELDDELLNSFGSQEKRLEFFGIVKSHIASGMYELEKILNEEKNARPKEGE